MIMKQVVFALILLVNLSIGYQLMDTFEGETFFDQFDFFTDTDPTHGFVKYVDRKTASNNGYIQANSKSVYMGVDHSAISPNGRPSVRITSQKSWNTGLFVLILSHMPGGQCGSWPAFWTVGTNWPNNGEIDIIEGVNKADVNQMTLHTSPNCQMTTQRNMTGKTVGNDCNVYSNYNSGCGVQSVQPNSYGAGFNQNGGGAYVMELTGDGVKMWYFSKQEMPRDIVSAHPNPSSWRIPDAAFPFGSACTFSHYGPQQIVFDSTFCGDWAGNGNIYGSSGCPSTCEDFVANNPKAFVDYYWEVVSLRVYQ